MARERKRPSKVQGITGAPCLSPNTALNVHSCSPEDLRIFGMDKMAYIRAVERPGKPRYVICNADGTPITTMDNRAIAVAAVRQHNMALIGTKLGAYILGKIETGKHPGFSTIVETKFTIDGETSDGWMYWHALLLDSRNAEAMTEWALRAKLPLDEPMIAETGKLNMVRRVIAKLKGNGNGQPPPPCP